MAGTGFIELVQSLYDGRTRYRIHRVLIVEVSQFLRGLFYF
jgi:hypothetical protein